jgi:hypothetical protein
MVRVRRPFLHAPDFRAWLAILQEPFEEKLGDVSVTVWPIAISDHSSFDELVQLLNDIRTTPGSLLPIDRAAGSAHFQVLSD